MDPTIGHDEFARSLERLRMGVGASELHGSLAGFLCAGGVTGRASWLRDLALEEIAEAVAASGEEGVFERFFETLAGELDDPDLGFAPLLPDDDSSMEERATALVDWCRGFLGGIGLSGTDLGAGLEGDLGEVLGDFSRIAEANFNEGDSVEDDEEAYAEVVEYVRVGALLIRTELGQVPREATRH
jgi:hypothetical protein